MTVEDELRAFALELDTQDNAGTAHPYFLVQVKKRVYGIDLEYTDTAVWVDADGEADEKTAQLLEEEFDAGKDSDGWTRTGYVDTWVTVQAFLTRKGAEVYIEANGHRHRGEKRVYVESAYRNAEMIWLRKLPFRVLALLDCMRDLEEVRKEGRHDD